MKRLITERYEDVWFGVGSCNFHRLFGSRPTKTSMILPMTMAMMAPMMRGPPSGAKWPKNRGANM